MRKLFVKLWKSKQLELLENHKFEIQSRCSDEKKIYHYWIGKIKLKKPNFSNPIMIKFSFCRRNNEIGFRIYSFPIHQVLG